MENKTRRDPLTGHWVPILEEEKLVCPNPNCKAQIIFGSITSCKCGTQIEENHVQEAVKYDTEVS